MLKGKRSANRCNEFAELNESQVILQDCLFLTAVISRTCLKQNSQKGNAGPNLRIENACQSFHPHPKTRCFSLRRLFFHPPDGRSIKTGAASERVPCPPKTCRKSFRSRPHEEATAAEPNAHPSTKAVIFRDQSAIVVT